MSFATRVVIGLVAGLALGALLAAADSLLATRVAGVVEPVGSLWLNALRMTIIPLIVTMLITGVASAAETAATGRLAARALLLFVIVLTAAALLGSIVTPLALAWWPVSPDAAAAFRAGAPGADAIPKLPGLRDWLTNVIPANPFKAAADGDMLPLVIFALFFGFAAARVTADMRTPLLGFFRAVMETMLVMIRWILWAAPLGVFALALGVGTRGGVHAAGALAHYLVLMCTLGVLITVLCYPAAVAFGRVSLTRFVRALLPAQAVAISTQSSLASLPAMITGAQAQLGLPERVVSLTLPLAVSLFRITSPLFNISMVIFCAHVYGVELGATQIAMGVMLAVITNFSVVGLPSQLTLFNTTVPISLAMGVPLDLLPLLLAVEVIPDIFRTLGNVTGDVAVTAIVARGAPAEAEQTAPATRSGA
ncbi:MAG: cation:dicarboxylase symporter family transporter [Steroidobacteraceae bacterium]|nr:cation:dicarboxylase symporter family transporter [Steroidobacteraceae bacterium]